MRLNSPQINVMTKTCFKVSRSLIRDFGELENLQVSAKGPGDFVSSADKRTEKMIIQELLKVNPGYGIVTEESGIHNKLNEENRWIVDPIDGTMNFLNGVPHFAVSLGYEEKGEIKCGVIFDPIKNEMFYAEKGNGAYLNNTRIRVSNKSNIDECLFSSNCEGIKLIYPKLNLRNTGCAALDLAYVGCGRFDGYFHDKINIWDIAAGKIIIEEAGGKVNDINKFRNNKIDIRAANPNIYEKMIKKIDNF